MDDYDVKKLEDRIKALEDRMAAVGEVLEGLTNTGKARRSMNAPDYSRLVPRVTKQPPRP